MMIFQVDDVRFYPPHPGLSYLFIYFSSSFSFFLFLLSSKMPKKNIFDDGYRYVDIISIRLKNAHHYTPSIRQAFDTRPIFVVGLDSSSSRISPSRASCQTGGGLLLLQLQSLQYGHYLSSLLLVVVVLLWCCIEQTRRIQQHQDQTSGSGV